MSIEWCGPTTVLSNQSLTRLLDRARRTTCTPAQKRPSDSSAPLVDPWFEDSQPVPLPEVDPTKPLEIEHRQRKERTSIQKITTRPVVYPVYRGDPRTMLLMILLAVVCAAVAALVVF